MYLFFCGTCRGSLGPGGYGSIIVRVQKQTHAARIVWVASMSLGSSKTASMAAYNGHSTVCRRRRSAAIILCMLLGIALLLSLNFGCNAARASHTSLHYTEKRGVLQLMLKSQTGITSPVTSTLWRTLRQKLRWKPSTRFKFTHLLSASLPDHCKPTSTTMSTTGLKHHTPTKSGTVPVACGPAADRLRQRIYNSEQASRLCEATTGC